MTATVKGCTCGRCDHYRAPERRCAPAYRAATTPEYRRKQVLKKIRHAAETSKRHGPEWADVVHAMEVRERFRHLREEAEQLPPVQPEESARLEADVMVTDPEYARLVLRELQARLDGDWQPQESHSRKGLLCALVGVPFEEASLESRGGENDYRLRWRDQVLVTICGWEWGGVWPRIDREQADYKNDTGHWAQLVCPADGEGCTTHAQPCESCPNRDRFAVQEGDR